MHPVPSHTGYFTTVHQIIVYKRWRETYGVPVHKPKRMFGTALATSCIRLCTERHTLICRFLNQFLQNILYNYIIYHPSFE